MKIQNNCTIDKVLIRYEQGERNEEIQFLMDEISDFKKTTEESIRSHLAKYRDDYPDKEDIGHFMDWVENNVPAEFKGCVRNEYLKRPYDVLKKSIKRYKTIAEIGIPIENNSTSKNADHLTQWEDIAEKMAQYPPFFETHAHYNMSHFDKSRPELLKMMQKAGVARCIIPSVEAYNGDMSVNLQIKEQFDPYNWIYYAFASHPKYIWKDKGWDSNRWKEYNQLLMDPKCVAVGEIGLDYSYREFCPEHQSIQSHYFNRFIELANKHNLPVILHLRPGDFGEKDIFAPDVNKDALKILTMNPIHNGAVLHCFGGDENLMWDYLKCGVKFFGIGGRILNGEKELESAVRKMPEESILLETDAPYINTIKGISGPNTSFALSLIAEKIADLRKMSVGKLIKATYHNAERLFRI